MLTFFEMVGQRILEELKIKGLSQQQLSNKLNVSKQVVNKIIKGEKNTTILEINNIAEVLGISVDRLLRPISEKKYPTKLEEEEVYPVFMGSVATEAGRQGIDKGFKIIDMILEYEETLNEANQLINRSSTRKALIKKREFKI